MARIFISYSHQDEAWKDRLVRQLGVLATEGLETWDDRRISGGDDWQPEIEQAIANCDVALLLISAHFLTSQFILGKEIPPLLQRREQQGIRVIPVIISPCQWTRVTWLKSIQARPKDGKPLTGMNDHDAEAALCDLTGEVAELSSHIAPDHKAGQSLPPEKIDLTHLPEGAAHFLGREAELAELDAAWTDGGKTHIVQLIAPGGVGKTSVLKRWLDRLKAEGWRGAQRVFGWSFYSQGTGDDRQASEDHFLAEALKWFGVKIEASVGPWDKGRALADAVTASRTLLVLDGVEPLQYPPGPLAGELRAPGLKALLSQLASAGHGGLCLISSREAITDLAEWERIPSYGAGTVLRRDLGNLSADDGARLLHMSGAQRAGAAAIAADDEELQAASREVRGHALTLSLLGRYLALAFDGDIRQHGQVDFQEADAETQGGHAFKVMAAYETWFAREGDKGARELAALRLLGFFDRPASRESLRALRTAPAITGLTRPLVNLKPAHWQATLKRLQDCGLAFPGEADGSLDAHPLVREYLAATLKEKMPEAWREGHRRIYEQLKASAPQRPDTLEGLQPLYQAIAHGCLAGLPQRACDDVYVDRILRGTGAGGNYSSFVLGAIGADLGAVACFFGPPWQRLSQGLSVENQGWLLNEAAFSLCALGRLTEALEPARAGAETAVKLEDWKNAASSYGNLSELQLSLGQIATAVDAAQQAEGYAKRSNNRFERMTRRTTLANALHQQGDTASAEQIFVEAEAMQAGLQSEYLLLYSQRGFLYCDLLLTGAERAAWRGQADGAATERCIAVALRASKTLGWTERAERLLDIGLDHLTLARCAIYSALQQGLPPHTAQNNADQAVASLRAAGAQHHLPRGLLTRAWLRHSLGDIPGAKADLNEAHQIAARGNMKLFLADIALTRARLFHDRAELAKARALIDECGYGRRLPELADAEAKAAAEKW
ncbi:MAG TPA: TIR domain-containing protein [Rhodocyclaceae bacterium]